jgi:small subunit ribosomal protein S16
LVFRYQSINFPTYQSIRNIRRNMVKIRLRRVGSKRQASYRVVVTDSRSPRDGRFIEVIGFHNPRTEPETVQIQEDRALYWLSVGAQPTDAVTRLLKSSGTLARFERLKQGESIEALAAEAEEAGQSAPEVSPKTRDVSAAPAVEEPAAEEPAVEEPAAEEPEAEEEETLEPETEPTEAEGESEAATSVVAEAVAQTEDESEGEEQ